VTTYYSATYTTTNTVTLPTTVAANSSIITFTIRGYRPPARRWAAWRAPPPDPAELPPWRPRTLLREAVASWGTSVRAFACR
jgi:hypothetical protein